ncbi:MAG: cob(I)yrinic acid a,c-diamide adenosyltransferase, partial [Armatimonadetes bacterium]|nr:cob(I)yrinic acid a,c-diamide adenosyltransferase [Armatimonadota bacterium]
DIVVLDEVFGALTHGLISLDEVLGLIRTKPTEVELILTGRDAPPEVIEAADLVTEMVEVKHPFRRGVKARKGIEY